MSSELWRILEDTISSGMKSITEDLKELSDMVQNQSEKRLIKQVALLTDVLERKKKVFDEIRPNACSNVQSTSSTASKASYLAENSERVLTEKARELTLLTYTYGSLHAAIVQRINMNANPQKSSARQIPLEIVDMLIDCCYSMIATRFSEGTFLHQMLTEDVLRPVPYFEKRDIEYPLELDGIILTSAIGIPSSIINAPWALLSPIHEIAHDFDRKFALSTYYLRNILNEKLNKSPFGENMSEIQELRKENMNLEMKLKNNTTNTTILKQLEWNKRLIEKLSVSPVKFSFEIKQIWLGWLKEIIPDMFGVLLLGPTYVHSLLSMLMQLHGQYIREADDGSHPQPYIRGLIAITTLRLLAERRFEKEADKFQALWTEETFIPRIETVFIGTQREEYAVEEITIPMERYIRLLLTEKIYPKMEKIGSSPEMEEIGSLQELIDICTNDENSFISDLPEKLRDVNINVNDSTIFEFAEKKKFPLLAIAAAYRAREISLNESPDIDKFNERIQLLLGRIRNNFTAMEKKQEFTMTEQCLRALPAVGIWKTRSLKWKKQIDGGKEIKSENSQDFAKQLGITKKDLLSQPRMVACALDPRSEGGLIIEELKKKAKKEGLERVLKKLVPFLSPGPGGGWPNTSWPYY